MNTPLNQDELTALRTERDGMRCALFWYSNHARDIGDAAIASDPSRMIEIMQRLGEDSGQRALNAALGKPQP